MKNEKFSNLIQLNAETIGIKALDNEIVDYLNTEIDEKLNLILSQAKKFMRVSKRKTLKVDDLNHSIQFYNFDPLYGYDSYANCEYEKIENIKGLWRPKQTIIDIEDYFSKPLSAFPMLPFPHFHWLVIDGVKPNISENFIREEVINKTNNNNNELNNIIHKKMSIDSTYSLNNNNNIQIEEKRKKDEVKINPIIHNISKELQIFFENFKQRFRKEIKINKLNKNNKNLILTKELEISLNIIKTSPGVVELLPYILEFFMNFLTENDCKINMMILLYLNEIIFNKYFFLEPYLHQIIIILLNFILFDANFDKQEINFESIIKVKLLSIKSLKNLIEKYNFKYTNLEFDIYDILIDNKNLNNNNNINFNILECIFMLGPIFLKKFFEEKNIEETIKTIKNKYNNIEDDIKKLYIKNIKNEEFINIIQNEISNIDDLIQNNNYEYKQNICLYNTYLKSLNIIKEINNNN